MLSARDETLMRYWIDRGPDKDLDGMLMTRSVKGYYDGALGSRGARLLEDYSDKPGHRGVSGEGYGFDESIVEEAMKVGFRLEFMRSEMRVTERHLIFSSLFLVSHQKPAAVATA